MAIEFWHRRVTPGVAGSSPVHSHLRGLQRWFSGGRVVSGFAPSGHSHNLFPQRADFGLPSGTSSPIGRASTSRTAAPAPPASARISRSTAVLVTPGSASGRPWLKRGSH